MLNRAISALETEISILEKSALRNPPDTNLEYYFGTRVGQRIGLQKALDVLIQIRDEAEKAHEIRR